MSKVLTLRSTTVTLGLTVVAGILVTGLVTNSALHHSAPWYTGFDPTQQALTGLIVAALTGNHEEEPDIVRELIRQSGSQVKLSIDVPHDQPIRSTFGIFRSDLIKSTADPRSALASSDVATGAPSSGGFSIAAGRVERP